MIFCLLLPFLSLSDVYIIMVSVIDIFPGADYYILLGYSFSN